MIPVLWFTPPKRSTFILCADLPGGKFQVGQRLDVYDPHPRIKRHLIAIVLAVTNTQIRVHYKVSSLQLQNFMHLNVHSHSLSL